MNIKVNFQDKRLSTRAVEMPADEGFLFGLYSSTREDIRAALIPSAQKVTLLEHQYNAQKNYYAVIFPDAVHDVILLGKQPIGRLWVWRNADELRVVDISLLKEFRNCGFGTLLLQNLLNEAIETKRRLTLHVWKDNPAQRLYYRLGLVVTEETETHLKMERLSSGRLNRQNNNKEREN